MVQQNFTLLPPLLLEEVLLAPCSSAKEIGLSRLEVSKFRINLQQDVVVIIREITTQIYELVILKTFIFSCTMKIVSVINSFLSYILLGGG